MTKKYKANDENEPAKQQHCPCCANYVSFSERYPDYVCPKCIALATDLSGEKVVFFNTSMYGYGCQGKYVGSGKPYEEETCFINGIKCFADEAYFGGIVIRPVDMKNSPKEPKPN